MFRALLIVLFLAAPAVADNPPRYHKDGATVAKFHASKLPAPKPARKSAPQPSYRYIVNHYHVKGS